MRDKFCKGCRYNLRGLLGGECPECGLPFSLTNPRTYLTSDQIGRTRVGRMQPTRRRAKYFLGAVAVAWLLPYGLGLLIAFGLGNDDVALVGCCLYVVLYPLSIVVATVWMLEALMPGWASGIAANVLGGALVAGVLMSGQLVLITGINPMVVTIGIIVGLPAGLWRAHRQT